jgi:hypothetical protein
MPPLPSVTSSVVSPGTGASTARADARGKTAVDDASQTPSQESAPHEPAHDTAHDAAHDAARSAYDGKKKTLFMKFLDRFGTNAPQNEEQREQDLAYRAARKAEFDAALPDLARTEKPFDDVLRRAHKLLNEEKHFPLTLRISAVLLGNTLDAGAYRTGPNRAGDYRAPSAHDVPQLMRDFGAAMDRMLPAHDDADALRVAAWALTVMIRIHPFADGNGRTARAAMNLALKKSGHAILDFPADSEGVYKRSPIWARLKDHMRGFVVDVGWTMKDGMIPPPGYAKKVAGLLTDEIGATSLESLRARPDIQAIADALGHARAHGFGDG